jgi:energy-coupling factor transporter transmembrane protein EcfT
MRNVLWVLINEDYNLGRLSHRLIEATTWVLLIILTLWLTLFALSGSYISILLILCLIVSFAAAKWPFRKAFLCACIVIVLFFAFPFEVSMKRGDQLRVKLQPITYGLLTNEGYEKEERGEIAAGGCVVSPFSRHWRLSFILP